VGVGEELGHEDHGGCLDVARVFDAESAAVERHLRALVRDRSAAEDLLQDTFVRLAQEIVAGRQPTNPRAWLFAVATNLAISRGRRLAVAARAVGRAGSSRTDPEPGEYVIAAEASGCVARQLLALDAVAREAVVLAAYGYPGREIARRIGRTEVATRTLLCRARKDLRRRIETDPAWAA